MDWIGLTQDRDKWWTLAYMYTFGFHKMWGISCLSEKLVVPQEELCFIELLI
jgi:hypothetical protein